MAGQRELDDDYLKRKDFNMGMEKMVAALIDLKHQPPVHFTQLETVSFPATVDRTKDIPIGTKSLIFFPKAGAFMNGLGLRFNNQLYFEVGSVFPFTIPVLPEWRFLTIPASQTSSISGQLDFVFSSHEYQDLGALRGDSVNADGSINTKLIGSLANIPVVVQSTQLMGQVVLASAPRTAMTTSPNLSMTTGKGVLISINVTAVSGTGSIAPRLMCLDQAGRTYYGDVQPTPITAVGRYSYVIYPASLSTGIGSYAKVSQGIVTPTFLIRVEPADGSSYTYSVEVEELR